MKPTPFKTAQEAVDAARAAGVKGKIRLTSVDTSLAAFEGFVVGLGGSRLLCDGCVVEAYVETIKLPKGNRAGKWRLYLKEEGEEHGDRA